MWRNLTEDDLLKVLSAPETAGYQIAAASRGQDVVDETLAAVADQCRGYIADNPSNRLAAGLALPERAHLPALHLARVEMLTRLDLEVSEDRRVAAKNAIRFFERVADGKVTMEQPDGEDELDDNPATGGRMDTISSRPRIATRESLSGL